jgi:subtilase family serine protease
MRSRLISHLTLPLGLLLTTFSSLSYAAVPNRITAINGNSRATLHGSVSGHVKLSTDLGPAPQGTKLESLSLRFSLTPAQQADLTQLLAAQQNPSSQSYHQWLTPEQYGARFGLSSADLAKVSAWLAGQGFTITGTARSSTFITFSGTVAQAQQAFGTSIHSLSLNGEQHISNVTDAVLPAAIAGVVNAVTGLDDFKMKPRSRVRSVPVDSASPLYTQTVSGVTSHYIAPTDFYTIYDFNPLITNSITGTGFTVAVVGQTDPVLADVASFRAAAGLPASVPKTQLYGTDPGTSSADVDESHLDMEWSGAAAPGATILYVYGVDAFLNSMTGAVDNAVAPIISTSYGLCESLNSASSLNTLNALFQQANTEGITVVASSGDDGATDCDTSGLASEGLNVDFPGSSPFVTAGGGTMFSGDVNTPGTYWSTSNGTTGGSALSYIPEQVWNETSATQGGLDAGGAGGGGVSAFFAKPAWQIAAVATAPGNTPNDASRDVPDIAFNAASNHDGYIVCSQGSCANGFLSSSNTLDVFGGTSFVAPTFAGLVAVIEQKLGGTPNKGIGNVNPILYGLADGPTYSSIFHDITTGNNSVPCSQGTPNCPNGGSIGYSAGIGYDLASGLGSIDANALANGWATAIPSGQGSLIGTGITTTTLTTTASLCAISGTVPLTVTVAGSIASTAPTGTVQFFVDNVSVGSSPLTSGTATFTLPAQSSGGHTLSAVYSGDTNYGGSKGTLLAADGTLASVDFVSTTNPDFSLTPCSGAVTVQPGAVGTGVVFTVTPANGFTGTVNFIATNDNLAAATYAFSVSPVTISSTTAGTTSFVFTASAVAGALRAQLKPVASRPQSGRTPWYAAGSGATLACMLLLTMPRRRRWGALLAVMLSVAAFTAIGCSNSSTTGGGGGGGGGGTTPTPAGTYTYTITAVSATGNLVHSASVVVTVP